MNVPTASKISLAMRCAYPWVPGVQWPARDTSPEAELGTEVHRLAETLLADPKAEFVSTIEGFDLVGYRMAILGAVEDLQLGGQRAELAVECNTSTGATRVLDAPNRAYPKPSPVRTLGISGTADVLGPGLIVDWKSGQRARESSAAASWQLRFLAVAASKLWDTGTVEVALVHLGPAEYWIDRATFEPWDLDAFQSEIERLMVRLEAGGEEPRPGPHCHREFCPIRATCGAAVVKATEAIQRHLPMVPAVENEEQARAMVTGLKLAKAYLEQLEESLDAYARRAPFQLEGNLWYGLKETEQERVDLDGKPEAVALIRAELGEDALEYSTSKVAIDKAAKAKVAREVEKPKRGEGARLGDAVIEKLRKLGAVKLSKFANVKEFVRKDSAA